MQFKIISNWTQNYMEIEIIPVLFEMDLHCVIREFGFESGFQYSLEELRGKVQASENELREGLKKLEALEIDGELVKTNLVVKTQKSSYVVYTKQFNRQNVSLVTVSQILTSC